MTDLLTLQNICAGYGEAIVIPGLDLGLRQGESMAVLGRNGVGKTTLLNTIVGVTRLRSGALMLGGTDITRLRPEQRAAAGIGWVPQERNIFRSLTVEENMSAVARKGEWSVEKVYGLFPRLKERRTNLGSQLSGGEQQMLALGRALVLNPKLLLLDEPTEGLAPIIIVEMLAAITRLVRIEGMSALIVEQHAKKILGMTDKAIILERGTIVHASTSKSLMQDPDTLASYLGVGGK